MAKKNCWEIMKCGRQPGSVNSKKLEECPAALPNEYEGVNEGKYSGRFCWVIAGTFCEGEVQGTFVQKYTKCMYCKFFKMVQDEESVNFKRMPIDMNK